MKLIKYIVILPIVCAIFASCNESNFLKEKPLDFYSPENSLSTSAHFQSALNFQYNKIREMLWTMDADSRYALRYATDFAFNATDYYKAAKLNDYANVMVPTSGMPLNIWKANYAMISNANVVINRLISSTQVSEEDKKIFKGEALFFRSFAYRMLANLFGGVPLTLEEISVSRRDYVRATREEVYTQIKIDLEEAVALLPPVDKVKDGKINKQVAQHLLSEIYICLGMYDKAIETASAVIDYPALGLMTSRFGSRQSEKADVYWDLFRLNNQNRTSGNKEGLLVIQCDYLNSGSVNHNMPWTILPFYQNIKVTAKDKSGKEVTNTAFLGVSDGKGGRGVGWMQPTSYFFHELWAKGSNNDIRNSSYNIMRDVRIDNPASPAFGKWFVKDGYSSQADSIRQWFPFLTKVSRMNNFPDDLYRRDKNGEPIVNAFGEHLLVNGANCGYKDEYLFRLAETYLLRAEAYLGKGDKAKAAADVNVIRSRAQASPVEASEVNIDYILDERLRELYCEELRMLTLCRLGKLVDRNKRYNPKTGISIKEYHNLWPIPFSEIERNIYAEIKQNPGY